MEQLLFLIIDTLRFRRKLNTNLWSTRSAESSSTESKICCRNSFNLIDGEGTVAVPVAGAMVLWVAIAFPPAIWRAAAAERRQMRHQMLRVEVGWQGSSAARRERWRWKWLLMCAEVRDQL